MLAVLQYEPPRHGVCRCSRFVLTQVPPSFVRSTLAQYTDVMKLRFPTSVSLGRRVYNADKGVCKAACASHSVCPMATSAAA